MNFFPTLSVVVRISASDWCSNVTRKEITCPAGLKSRYSAEGSEDRTIREKYRVKITVGATAQKNERRQNKEKKKKEKRGNGKLTEEKRRREGGKRRRRRRRKRGEQERGGDGRKGKPGRCWRGGEV